MKFRSRMKRIRCCSFSSWVHDEANLKIRRRQNRTAITKMKSKQWTYLAAHINNNNNNFFFETWPEWMKVQICSNISLSWLAMISCACIFITHICTYHTLHKNRLQIICAPCGVCVHFGVTLMMIKRLHEKEMKLNPNDWRCPSEIGNTYYEKIRTESHFWFLLFDVLCVYLVTIQRHRHRHRHQHQTNTMPKFPIEIV